MGIESTRYITKDDAVYRISKIINHINNADWSKLSNICSHEDRYFIENYINEYNDIHKEFIRTFGTSETTNLENFFDKVLEDFMDKPGVRYSIFDNYLIID